MKRRVLSLMLVITMLTGIFAIQPSAAETGEPAVKTDEVICYYDNYRVVGEVTFSSVQQNISAYLAVYNENGKLVRFAHEDVLKGAESTTLSLIADETYIGMTYKLFLWDKQSLNPHAGIIKGTVHSKAAVLSEAFLEFVNSEDVTKESLCAVLEECYYTDLMEVDSFLDLTEENREDVCWDLIGTQYNDIRVFHCELMLACGTPSYEVVKVKGNIVDTALSNSSLAETSGRMVQIELTNHCGTDWENYIEVALNGYGENDIITVYEGKTNAIDYFGYAVYAYIAVNDESFTLIHVTPDLNSVYVLEVVDSLETANVDYDALTFEYYESEDSIRPIALDFELSIAVYVNGVEQKNGTDAETWFNDIPDKASKVVFMANKGEDYSKVFITSYIYMKTVAVDEGEGLIFTDYMDIELGGSRPDYFSYSLALEDGTEIGIDDLKENDILNILCNPIAEYDINDADIVYIDIVVTRNTVEGIVEENLGNGIWVINGVEYKNYGAGLAVGDVARFFLTIDGKLYDTDYAFEQVNRNYGFITAVGETASYGEMTYEVKMFTLDGKVDTYTIADKLYVYEEINGDYCKSPMLEGSAQAAYFAAGGKIAAAVADKATKEAAIAAIPNRFITYKLNSDSEINEIRFAEGRAANNEFNVTTGTSAYNPNTQKFGGMLIADTSKLIYAAPEYDGGTWNFDETAIEILPFDALDEDGSYGTPYLFDIRDNEIGVAFVTEGVSASKKYALAVVTGTSTVSNDQTKISFFQNGEFLSYVVSEDCNDGLDALRAGDVFQYTLSGDEILKGIKVADYNSATKTITLEAGLDTATVKYVAGKVTDKESKYIVVAGEGDLTFGSVDAVGTVAVYNTARSGKNAVTALSSLSGLKKTGATYTYNVILRLEDDEIVDAIEYQTANETETETTTEVLTEVPLA